MRSVRSPRPAPPPARDVPFALIATCCLSALTGCGTTAPQASKGCEYPLGRPLADDIRLPESGIIHRATRILRHAARHDFRSGLPQVLGSSAYSIDEVGEWSLNDKPGYRRQFRIIGAAMVIRVARPHPVAVDVIVAGTGWLRGSKNYRFSRRYGYVPYRARLISKSLMDLSVLIDVRRGKVASVEVGPSGSVDQVVPLHGSCPEKPPPPGYD